MILSIGLLSSCYKDEQLVDYDYMNGQTLVFVPSLVEKVDYVVYIWDNNEIAKETSMPFILHYPLINQASGIHTLKYKVVSTNEGNCSSITSSYEIKRNFTIK